MNLAAMQQDWRLEGQRVTQPKRDRIQPYTTYTKSDIESFVSDIRSGKAKAKAGRDNGIPTGSVHHLARTAGV